MWSILACFSELEEKAEEKPEDRALSLAIASQTQEAKTVLAAPEGEAEAVPLVSKKRSIERVDVSLSFKKLSAQHQGYFSSEEAVEILRNGLDLPSPVLVEVRWMAIGSGRGSGEIVVYVEKPITKFTELQLEANTLMEYRKWIGANLDLRVLAFDLVLEGDGCRLPIVKHSALQEALISPCLERGEKKVCAQVQADGTMVYSSMLTTEIKRCFHSY